MPVRREVSRKAQRKHRVKTPELKEDDKNRKFKGRVVFQGNRVLDTSWEAAMFQELSSCPATMQAAKAADCYGLVPGDHVMQADAEMAYTQSLLGEVKTWVRIAKEQWRQEWTDRGMRDPVCPLVRDLYGHPDAGGSCVETHTGHGPSRVRSVGGQTH